MRSPEQTESPRFRKRAIQWLGTRERSTRRVAAAGFEDIAGTARVGLTARFLGKIISAEASPISSVSVFHALVESSRAAIVGDTTDRHRRRI
jgi:hypothetical protein